MKTEKKNTVTKFNKVQKYEYTGIIYFVFNILKLLHQGCVGVV